ncbi:MAG: cation:proton antiporter [Lachnospiraceae bacterium]|nr:cation:proton antiporter [Lachnospiraceae bacterium]
MISSFLYDRLEGVSGATVAILSVSVMLIAGFLMTRITKRLKLPNVTAYIVAGILVGPFCLNLVPETIVSGMDFLPDIALAFIAFATGEYFRLETLRRNGIRVIVITMAEAFLATILVMILCVNILHLPIPFSVVLSALAAATAPASTMMTIRQVHAKGVFVDTLLQVVAVDNIVGLLAYSVAVSIATASIHGAGIDAVSTMRPVLVCLAGMILGGLFGAATAIIMKMRHSTDNRLIIAVTMLFTFCGVCAVLETSPLLGCMAMGTVYINLTDDERLFRQLGYFNPPILMLFFVRSGISFDLSALFVTNDAIGGSPLIVIGIGYFAVRIIGKYAGAFLGSLAVRAEAKVRTFLGLALIPQAGIAIGLAELGARTLGGSSGKALQTIILASSVLYELIGPACAKGALYLSGSYSNDLDQIVGQTEVAAGEEKPSAVEELIAQINRIQHELATESGDTDEQIFSEEADQHYEDLAKEEPKKNKEKDKTSGKKHRKNGGGGKKGDKK